jgi:hypothetical protein
MRAASSLDISNRIEVTFAHHANRLALQIGGALFSFAELRARVFCIQQLIETKCADDERLIGVCTSASVDSYASIRQPSDRIILGDSSMASMDPLAIQRLTGDRYFNFAYGGGTLPEAIDTYWLARSKGPLRAVYLGIALFNFNEYQNLDRVADVETVTGNAWSYLTNRLVLHAAALTALSASTGAHLDSETPDMSRAAFWAYQLNESLPQLLLRYRFPANVAVRLQGVAEDCRRNGTRLVFVIPPTHIELQNKIAALGRSPAEQRFKAFIAGLADVYDFDYPNAFTSDRANFSDPFHPANDAEIVDEIWGKSRRYVRISMRDAPVRSGAEP